MSEKRRDNKNRVLRNEESQRADRRHVFKYIGSNGKQQNQSNELFGKIPIMLIKSSKVNTFKENKYMIKVLFVCHGNICRSPMAEFVMKDLIKKQGLTDLFFVSSSATSTEEIGNPVHHGTRKKLSEFGISTKGKYAIQLTKADYKNYDYLIGMEQRNITNMLRIVGNDPEQKIHRLLDYTNHPRDIADPWYTGNFDLTYADVKEGCTALLEYILREQNYEKN